MMDSQPLLSSLPGRPSRLQSQQLGMEIWGSGLQALIACLLSPPHTHPFRGPQIFTGLLLQKWQPQGEGGRAREDTFALWTSFCFRISKTPLLWAPGPFGPVYAFACPGHVGRPL